MSGFLKKMGAGALVLALIFSTLYALDTKDAVAEDSDFRIDFVLKTMDSKGEFIDRSEFYTEELFQFAPDVQTSGAGVNLRDAVLELKVPKSPQRYWGRPSFIDSSQSGVTTEISETDTDYIVKYKYTSLRGGTVGTYPTGFRFYRSTPNGTTLTPTWTLYQSDGSVLRQSTKTYTAVAKNEYTVDMRNDGGVKNSEYLGWDGQEVDKQGDKYRRFGCRVLNPSEKDTTVVPASGCQIRYDLETSFIPFPGVDRSYGRYEPKTNRLTVTAPKGVKLVGSYTPGSDGFKDNGDGTFTALQVWSNWENEITLDYVGMPFDTKFDLKVTFETDYDDPALHKTYTSTASTILSKHLVDFTQSGSLGLDRRYYDDSSWRYENYAYARSQIFLTRGNELVYDQTAKEKDLPGIRWETSIWNNNNGSDIDARPYRNGSAYLVKKLTDYGMDPRLAYRSFKITYVNTLRDSSYENTDKFKEYFASIGNALYGVKADGSREKIAENLGIDQEIFISKTGERLYDSLELEFNEPVVLDNSEFKYVISVLPTDEEMGKWERNEYSSEQTYRGEVKVEGELALPDNTGKYTLKNATVTEETRKNWNDELKIWKLDPRISKGDWNVGRNITYVNCENRKIDLASGNCGRVITPHFYFDLQNSWGVDVYKAKNFTQVVLLPAGIEYVPNDPKYRDLNYPFGHYLPKNPTPKVIPNYRGTGMTGLVWEYGNIGPSSITGSNLERSEVQVALDVSLYSNQGKNTVRSYLLWDNGDEVKPEWGEISDDDPLKKTLKGNETGIAASHDIYFTPPLEIITKKYASADGQAWAYNSAPSDLGGDVYYKVSVTNNSAYPRGDIHIIDVLPHKSDHSVAANEYGEYPARTWLYSDPNENVTTMTHSAFTTPLVQSLESLSQNAGVLEDWEFFYSLTEQGADLASVRDSQWYTADQITDWAAVKSIKIQLKAGKKLDKNTTKEFVMRGQVPYTKETVALPDGYKAVNSVAQSVNGTDYLEANKTTSEFMRYKIKGFVFKDFNGDGKRSADEDKVGNIKVELLHAADNTPVVDIDGTPLTGVTNDKGEYEFTAFKRGDYRVRFTTSEYSQFTTVPSSGFNEENDNSTVPVTTVSSAAGTVLMNTLAALPTTSSFARLLEAAIDRLPAAPATTPTPIVGISGSTHVDPAKPIGYANASVGASTRDLVIFKHDQDGQPIAGVKFEVKWKETTPGNLEPNPIPTFTTGTTGKDGLLIYKNLPYGKYTVTELSVPEGVTKLGAPVDITVSSEPFACDEKGVALGYAPILNQVVKGTVKVVKADADNPDSKLAGAVFVLKNQDGEVVYTSNETGRDGVATFEKVAFGSYTLAEKTAPDLYNLSTETRSVVINQVDQVVTFDQPFTNTIFKGGVKVKKLDRDTRAPLAGAVFAVFKDDKEIARASSGEDGIATITGIPYGRGYRVKEVQAPVGYLLSDSWKSYEFAVTREGEITDYSSDDNAFTDESIRGNISFRKVDDNGSGIDNVEFELQKRSDSTVVATETSRWGGTVEFRDVPYGDYKIVEKTAPENYIMNTTPVDVEVRNQWEWVQVNDVVNKLKKADISFKVVDKDTREPVQGVEYRLCNSGGWPCQTATTDEQGNVLFQNMLYGKYELREDRTLDMYLSNDTVYTPEIVNDGEDVDLGTIELVKKTGRIILTKVDDENGNRVAGATFELKRADGTVVDTQTTGEDGELVFEKVPYGEYKVVEKTAPAGYRLNQTEYNVNIWYAEQNENIGEIRNTRIKPNVVFTVVDKETHEPLDGVEYKLCAKGDQEGSTCITAISTGGGKVSFTGVRYGEYEVSEAKGLPAYVPDTAKVLVEIVDDRIPVELSQRELVKIRGSVALVKVDGENPDQVLAGVTFELRDPQGNVVATQISDQDGKVIFSDLLYGDYTLVEVNTIAGYVLSEKATSIQIRENGLRINLGKIGNDPVRGNIKVIVRDKDTKQVIAKAEYVLKDQEGKVVATAVSDQDGILSFTGIRYGKYTLSLSKAPGEYLNTSKTQVLEVVTNNATVTGEDMLLVQNLKVTNPKAENPQVVAKTVETGLANTGVAGAEIIAGLVLLGAIGVVLRTRRIEAKTENRK